MNKEQNSMIHNLRHDIPAGLSVFFIALPLCLGIALASGAPLISGIISGIIAGILIGLLSNSQVSVSGPAAGLTFIVANSIQILGGFEYFLVTVIVSGLFQIIFGLIRLGQMANYFPISVLRGMLAAIGIVIILKQIPHALGRDKDYEGDLSFWGSDTNLNTIGEIIRAFQDIHPTAVLITIVSLVILAIGETKFIKNRSYLRTIPGPFLIVIASVIINEIVNIVSPNLYLGLIKEHLVNFPVIKNPTDFFSMMNFPDFSILADKRIYLAAFIIAIISSIETLFSLEAAEKLDPQKRIASPDKELLAQGVGNMAAGFLGGIPISAVIVRTSANVYYGAKTRYSTVFHAIFLLFGILLFSEWLNKIPLVALSAILFFVGYKLTNINIYKDMYRQGIEQFLPFIVTVLGIVFTDLLLGLFMGMAVGMFFIIKGTHYNAFTLVSIDDYYLLKFNKDISFINRAELKEKLSSIPTDTYLIIDGSKALIIDADVYDVLMDYLESAKYKNITVELKNCDTQKVKFPKG